MNASPYRQYRELAALLPADRRWLKRVAIGAAFFAAGVVAVPLAGNVRDAITDATVEWTFLSDVYLSPPARYEPTRVLELGPAAGAFPKVDEGRPFPRLLGASSPDDEARASVGWNPALARRLLLPIVTSGVGCDDDVRALRAACTSLADFSCIELLDARDSS
jgi:hypothetical protein